MIDGDILDSFKGRGALVTGGTGMIGRQVVRILCDAGAVVKTVSLDRITVHPDAEHIVGDLTDFGFCKEITRGVDYVLHVAGIKGSIEVTKARPASFFVPMLMMNTNVLEAARVGDVGRVVYTSSVGAYDSAEVLRESESSDDRSPMDEFPGWAKRMAEKQVRAYAIQYGLDNFAVVRPCNVYGPGDNFDPQNAMVIPSLMFRIRHKEDPVVVWGDGSAVRDFAYSADVAEGVVLALHHGTGSGFVNLGSGTGYSIKELVETLADLVPFNYRFDATKPAGFHRRVMDIDLADKMLGWRPATSLREGLGRTWEWYIENEHEHLVKTNYFRA